MTPFQEADARLGAMHGYAPVEVMENVWGCPGCGAMFKATVTPEAHPCPGAGAIVEAFWAEQAEEDPDA